jgi:hypothetical protein
MEQKVPFFQLKARILSSGDEGTGKSYSVDQFGQF